MTRHQQAGKMLVEIFMRLQSGFGEVTGFRTTLALVTRSAEENVTAYVKSNLQVAKSVLPSDIFAAGSIYAGSTGLAKLIQDMAKGQLNHTWTFRDKASLVLAHTALDGGVSDLLGAAAVAEPSLFAKNLADKKISLCDAMKVPGDQLLEGVLAVYIKELERRSLVDRIRKLLDVLEPQADHLKHDGWQYLESEIRRIDNVRHDLVHGRAAELDSSRVDADIAYMQDTAFNLWGIVLFTQGLYKSFSEALCT